MDDLLQEGRSDSQGRFQLQGSTYEYTPIDPKLNIYHDWYRNPNDDRFSMDNLPCQRRITIKIPDAYISSGPNPQRYYDAGTIQLAGQWSGETRDCLNK